MNKTSVSNKPNTSTVSSQSEAPRQKGWRILLDVLLAWTASIPVIGLFMQALMVRYPDLGPKDTWIFNSVVMPYKTLSDAFNKKANDKDRTKNFLIGAVSAILPIQNIPYLWTSIIAVPISIVLMPIDAYEWIAHKISKQSTNTPEDEKPALQGQSNSDAAHTAAAATAPGATFLPSGGAANSASSSSSAANKLKGNAQQPQSVTQKGESPAPTF